MAGRLRRVQANMAPRRLKRKKGGPIIARMQEFAVRPDPDDPRLTRRVAGIDQDGKAIETAVVTERPLTLFLNGREIVTMMTIGDHPDYLAVGYLLNQNMLRAGRPDHRRSTTTTRSRPSSCAPSARPISRTS